MKRKERSDQETNERTDAKKSTDGINRGTLELFHFRASLIKNEEKEANKYEIILGSDTASRNSLDISHGSFPINPFCISY